MAKKGVIQNSVLAGGADLAVAPGADVQVNTTAGPLATLWADRDAAGGQVNPFTADANGFFQVYATPGRYKITVTVGAEVQIFEDVVVQARREPEIMWDAIEAQADVTPTQTVNALGVGNGVALALQAEMARAPHSLLTLNASDIEVVSGAPGLAEIAYNLQLGPLDGGVAPVAGDFFQIESYIRVGGVEVSRSKDIITWEAKTGWLSQINMKGAAVIEVADSTQYLIDVFVFLLNRSSGTLEFDILQDSKLSVRRAIDIET